MLRALCLDGLKYFRLSYPSHVLFLVRFIGALLGRSATRAPNSLILDCFYKSLPFHMSQISLYWVFLFHSGVPSFFETGLLISTLPGRAPSFALYRGFENAFTDWGFDGLIIALFPRGFLKFRSGLCCNTLSPFAPYDSHRSYFLESLYLMFFLPAVFSYCFFFQSRGGLYSTFSRQLIASRLFIQAFLFFEKSPLRPTLARSSASIPVALDSSCRVLHVLARPSFSP